MLGLATLAFEGVLISHAGVHFFGQKGDDCSQSGIQDKFDRFCGVYSPTFQSKGEIRLPPPSPRPR